MKIPLYSLYLLLVSIFGVSAAQAATTRAATTQSSTTQSTEKRIWIDTNFKTSEISVVDLEDRNWNEWKLDPKMARRLVDSLKMPEEWPGLEVRLIDDRKVLMRRGRLTENSTHQFYRVLRLEADGGISDIPFTTKVESGNGEEATKDKHYFWISGVVLPENLNEGNYLIAVSSGHSDSSHPGSVVVPFTVTASK